MELIRLTLLHGILLNDTAKVYGTWHCMSIRCSNRPAERTLDDICIMHY